VHHDGRQAVKETAVFCARDIGVLGLARVLGTREGFPTFRISILAVQYIFKKLHENSHVEASAGCTAGTISFSVETTITRAKSSQVGTEGRGCYEADTRAGPFLIGRPKSKLTRISVAQEPGPRAPHQGSKPKLNSLLQGSGHCHTPAARIRYPTRPTASTPVIKIAQIHSFRAYQEPSCYAKQFKRSAYPAIMRPFQASGLDSHGIFKN
jgi:hypothetical protein